MNHLKKHFSSKAFFLVFKGVFVVSSVVVSGGVEHENDGTTDGKNPEAASHKKEPAGYFPLYWLFNRDPHFID